MSQSDWKIENSEMEVLMRFQGNRDEKRSEFDTRVLFSSKRGQLFIGVEVFWNLSRVDVNDCKNIDVITVQKLQKTKNCLINRLVTAISWLIFSIGWLGVGLLIA